MPSPFLVRLRIAELEQEEQSLHDADKLFWEQPDHSTEAQVAFDRRRERTTKVRQELQDLQHELGIESFRSRQR